MEFYRKGVSLKLFFLIILIAVLATLLLTEIGLFLAGSALGYEMEFEFLNTQAGEDIDSEYDAMFISSGRLMALIFQVTLFYVIILLSGSRYLLGFLFFPLGYRMISYILAMAAPDTFLSQAEFLIANYYDISTGLIIAIISIYFIILNLHAVIRTSLSWKRYFQGALFSLLLFAIIVFLTNLI